MEKDWRGSTGHPNTNGFYVMASLPQGVPLFVKREALSESYLAKAKKLLAKNMMDACKPQGLAASVPWLYKAAKTGTIPIHRYLEDTIPPGQWGRLAEVGAVEGQMGKLRIIDKTSYWDTSLPNVRSSLWALPICPKDVVCADAKGVAGPLAKFLLVRDVVGHVAALYCTL